MRKLVLVVLSGVLSASLALFSYAEQALVRSYENQAQPIGQAYLGRYGKRCIAILPGHVSKEAAEVPVFLSEVNDLLGESSDVAHLGDDLAVAIVSGTVAQSCGYSIATMPRATSQLIASQSIVTLRTINSDGTVAQMAVTVIDDDGKQFLRIRPVNSKIEIRKGHSGSLVMAGDKPVGILLSVNPRHGVGVVMRMDSALSRVETHLAKRKQQVEPQHLAETRPDTADLAAMTNGAQITGWSSLPVDAAHRPVNLTTDEFSAPWRTSAEKGIASIEIDLAGEKIVISRIELDSHGLEEKTEAPGTVEVMVNIGTDKKRWRSLLSRDLEYDDTGKAILQFAPTWARDLKLVFGVNKEAQDNYISLRRIHITE